MRLLIKFEPIDEVDYLAIGKYEIQGFIYSLLSQTNTFNNLHNQKGFKFFNFSNIFPLSRFERNSMKKLIISSPNPKFIMELYNVLREKNIFKLNKYKMEILKVELLKDKKCTNFITGTPIVLYENNKNNIYYSFRRNPNFEFFFERLKDNAIKKYNAFYNTDFILDESLFTNFEFVKEVAVKIKKHNNEFIVIGSLWKNLKFNITKENKRFYNFLFDAGLGEKNSLGFSFLNCMG